MKSLIKVLAGLGLAATVGFVPAQAEIVSATEVTYDANLRPVCTATRMNPATFGDAAPVAVSAGACTLKAEGGFGPDRITKTIYDNAGQVTEVWRAWGVSGLQQRYAAYTYSPNGQKISETDANGNKTVIEYDPFDRVKKLIFPSTTTPGQVNTNDYEEYGYDANNNRTSFRRRNGQTITYTYDNLNRTIVENLPDYAGNEGGSIRDVYTGYDLQGKILWKRFGSTGGAGVSYAYDGLGRVSSVTDMDGRTKAYQYNTASARTQMTLPDNTTLTYGLDGLNRLTSVSHSTAGSLFSQAYDNLGRRISLNKGASDVSYGYDDLGRLTSLSNNVANSNRDITWSFTSRNPANQIMSWGADSTVYDYRVLTGGTDNRTFNGLNQDAAIAAVSGGGFDANGNLKNDGNRVMVYDVMNRLLSVTSPGKVLNLTYDPEGRLYQYTINGAVTYLGYDGVNLIGEYSASGSSAPPVRQYVHGTGVDEPIVWFEGSNYSAKRYFVQNYQGSVIGYTDTSGNLQEVYKYGPWGEPLIASATTPDLVSASFSGSRFRYTGQTVLPDASLYYYKARVYDPTMGRFLQTDPIGSKDDLDLYAYVAGDPINKSDPTGLAKKRVPDELEKGNDAHITFTAFVRLTTRRDSKGRAALLSNVGNDGKGTKFDGRPDLIDSIGKKVFELKSTRGALRAMDEADYYAASTDYKYRAGGKAYGLPRAFMLQSPATGQEYFYQFRNHGVITYEPMEEKRQRDAESARGALAGVVIGVGIILAAETGGASIPVAVGLAAATQ